jgi:hypothetical protein
MVTMAPWLEEQLIPDSQNSTDLMLRQKAPLLAPKTCKFYNFYDVMISPEPPAPILVLARSLLSRRSYGNRPRVKGDKRIGEYRAAK